MNSRRVNRSRKKPCGGGSRTAVGSSYESHSAKSAIHTFLDRERVTDPRVNLKKSWYLVKKSFFRIHYISETHKAQLACSRVEYHIKIYPFFFFLIRVSTVQENFFFLKKRYRTEQCEKTARCSYNRRIYVDLVI